MRFLKVFVFLFMLGCIEDRELSLELFSDVTKDSGILFQNTLTFTEQLNPYTYRNFYNGAGVAIGDINNDGLLDIYFAGNQVDNKLYLNQGNLVFKDITETAGVACSGVWSTGVTFVDINGDGLLDIYVCKSGNPDAPNRHNELFINNGDLTFTEKSKEYGLDITGLSVQAAFFDYDKDGDLDCYLLTNSIKSVGNYDVIKDQRETPDPQGGGNKFFINENGKFKDYTEEVGIYRSAIGFGLGITLGDFNNDSWTDIFISNDFFERDYLYINDQKGSFIESLTHYFSSISMGSMGADFADLDNDGIPELFVTEMLPDSLNRKKTKTIYDSWDRYQWNIQNGYYHQFPRNVLQKKINKNTYVEIGRMAGVAASEWSWGALLFDMDNDGRRDIFIANGIYKDLLDRDYLAYSGAEDNVRRMIKEKKNVIMKLIDEMPSSQFPNYAFRNDGEMKFTNMSLDWGLGEPMFSSGSAFGDLDNDGDLDIVVNNINAPSAIFRNNSDSSEFKSIQIALSSNLQNKFAMGASVTAFIGSAVFFSDNFVTRGFQSSVQPYIHIGLGKGITTLDSLIVQWAEGGYSVLYNIPCNQKLSINKNEVTVRDNQHQGIRDNRKATFKMELVENSIYKHQSSGLIDFNRNRLLPMMYSSETPSMTKADINNDGAEEVYIGGGKDQAGVLIQYQLNKFNQSSLSALTKYNLAEETKSIFVDVDGDGDQDLYLATGGRFFPKASSALMDKIFLNDGKGVFSESPHVLPFTEYVSTSVVIPIDFDNDNDFDLLIGERFHPFVYGSDGRAYLFENDGRGLFTDVTMKYAPALKDIGMVTDAVAVDFNNDDWADIVLVGDWMPIIFLKNNNGFFSNFSTELKLDGTEGWWHEIETADLNKDGKPDFVIGNHGLNTFFKPGDRMYVNDFDYNGAVEQIFCANVGGKYYPISDKDEFLSQLPSLKKQLLYYKDYGKKSLGQLFPESVLGASRVFQVNELSSILLVSNGEKYDGIRLPTEAQYSPIYAMCIVDIDEDGIYDLLVGGNNFQVKPQFGRFDASQGWFFKGVLENKNFSFEGGIDLNVKGQIRDIEYMEINGVRYVLFAKHDDDLEIYKITN